MQEHVGDTTQQDNISPEKEIIIIIKTTDMIVMILFQLFFVRFAVRMPLTASKEDFSLFILTSHHLICHLKSSNANMPYTCISNSAQ